MKTFVLYTDGGQESERVRQLLSSLDGEYLEYHLGIDFSDKQFRMEFGSDAEYPQVAVGVEHIGGLKETLRYFMEQGDI